MLSFYSGKYRNVFKELGYDEKEIEDRLNAAFQTIFYGSDVQRLYYPVGGDMGYITDTGNHDVRTEGMSYGMMLCVQMDKKEEFDRLWKWVKAYMWISEGNNKGYFAWSCALEGKKNSEGSAPDGEEYFAMALFFAANRWGCGSGIFNYEKEARSILHACIHNQKPMWEPKNKLIKFVAECDWSDPSYHMPHFYELFALWADEADREFWREAASASREYLKNACHPVTGLCAEYADYEGVPYTGHQEIYGRHDWYYSDAYRVPANIGLDYTWFGADEWECQNAAKIRRFFAGRLKKDENGIHYGIYDVEGNALAGEALHPVAIIATNAMSCLATDRKIQNTIERLNAPIEYENAEKISAEAVRLFWETPLRTGDRRYYDNCLYLFAFLALSGNYRIWK